jgi:hypothetical protein
MTLLLIMHDMKSFLLLISYGRIILLSRGLLYTQILFEGHHFIFIVSVRRVKMNGLFQVLGRLIISVKNTTVKDSPLIVSMKFDDFVQIGYSS